MSSKRSDEFPAVPELSPPGEAPKEPLRFLKVRATEAGYIGDIYRNPGDVFVITPREIPRLGAGGKAELDVSTGKLKTVMLSVEQQFSAKWMEPVSANEPERITTAKDDIAKQIKELNSRMRASDPEA